MDCSRSVGGSIGVGGVLLRQSERGRRSSKIQQLKTNNSTVQLLDVMTPFHLFDGIENMQMFTGPSEPGLGVLFMSSGDVYCSHKTVFSFYNFCRMYNDENDCVVLFGKGFRCHHLREWMH